MLQDVRHYGRFGAIRRELANMVYEANPLNSFLLKLT